jgi:hypothetical protein
MWERKPLNLEFKKYPSFLLGSMALYKKFQHETFIDDKAKSFLYDLYERNIPVDPDGHYPANYYYRMGILERNPKSFKKRKCWVDQYRVISSRIRIIEQEIEKTDYVKYMDQLIISSSDK